MQPPAADRLAAPRPQGCAGCHSGIDPWGLPLEQFDAAGLFRAVTKTPRLKLPMPRGGRFRRPARLPHRPAHGPRGLRRRNTSPPTPPATLTYNELVFLEKGLNLRRNGYRMELVDFVIRRQFLASKFPTTRNFRSIGAFLKGTAGMTLAPVLKAMGKDVAEKRRSVSGHVVRPTEYVAARQHGIDELSWFRAEGRQVYCSANRPRRSRVPAG